MSRISIWNQDAYKKKYEETKRRASTSSTRSIFKSSSSTIGPGSGREAASGSKSPTALQADVIKEEAENLDSEVEEDLSERVSEVHDINEGSKPTLIPPHKHSLIAHKPPPLTGVEITIHVRRRYEYYIYKIIVVFNLVIMMGWGIGFTPHDEVTGRLTMVFTAATAIFAFMYIIQQELPKLAFLTFIDKQMVSGIFNLAAQALQTVVAYKLDSPRVDLWFSIGIPCLYIMYNVAISVKVYRARSEDALNEHRENRNAMSARADTEQYKLSKQGKEDSGAAKTKDA